MRVRCGWGLAGLLALAPATAWAGMPMVLLSDLARMRLQAISFFVLVFLASAWVVQRLWNGLRGDFPRLPHIGYRRAASIVALWGLLFLLVLTMISGARELLTPGAWRKDGLTYTLNEPPRPAAAPRNASARRQALDRLRVALWTYAGGHGGKFPPDQAAAEIPAEVWRLPDPGGARYLYRGGQTAGQGAAPLAFEPGVFGDDRLILLTSGTIVSTTAQELDRLLDQSAPGRGSP